MQKTVFSAMCLALVLPLLLLAGCSDFDEMKSRRQLVQAEALLQEGQEAQAEELLVLLLNRYPGTQAADGARRHLQRLQDKREMLERQAFEEILGSFQQVLSGYRTLHAGYPASLEALDASGYFFDTSYLEEVVPAGYRVYLWLYEDGSGYRAWCVADDKPRGYAIDEQGGRVVPFEREAELEKFSQRFQEAFRGGRLVALTEHN